MNSPAEAAPAHTRGGDFLGYALALAFAVIPFLLILAPRAAAFAPPVLAVCGLAGYCGINRRLPAFSRSLLVTPLVIAVAMGLSSLWSITPAITLSQTLATFPIFLGAAILIALTQALEGKYIDFALRLLPFLLIAGGALCLVNLYGNGIFYHVLHGPEQEYTNSKPNRSIITLFLFSIIALPQLLRKRDIHSGCRAAVLFAVLLAIFYKTDSQAAQLGLIAASLLYFFFPYGRAWTWKLLAFGLFTVLFTAPFIAQWMFHTLTPYAITTGWLRTGYAANRMEIWDFISRRALERPFTGFGAESTRSMTFDTAMLYHKKNTVLHPHNFILQLWIEFGIWGPVLTAGFFGMLLKTISRLKAKQARLVLPLFGTTILIAAITYGLWQGWWVGLLALLMAYSLLSLRAGDFYQRSK